MFYLYEAFLYLSWNLIFTTSGGNLKKNLLHKVAVLEIVIKIIATIKDVYITLSEKQV